MRTLVCCLALALAAACGGKTSSAPAAPANAGGDDDTPGPGSGDTCCCELPAEEPLYDIQATWECETDSHGVCVEDELCGA